MAAEKNGSATKESCEEDADAMASRVETIEFRNGLGTSVAEAATGIDMSWPDGEKAECGRDGELRYELG